MEARLLRPNEAAAYLGLSASAFRRLADKEEFPSPIYLGERSPRYDRRALDNYLDARLTGQTGYDDPDEALGGHHEDRQAHTGRRHR